MSFSRAFEFSLEGVMSSVSMEYDSETKGSPLMEQMIVRVQ